MLGGMIIGLPSKENFSYARQMIYWVGSSFVFPKLDHVSADDFQKFEFMWEKYAELASNYVRSMFENTFELGAQNQT